MPRRPHRHPTRHRTPAALSALLPALLLAVAVPGAAAQPLAMAPGEGSHVLAVTGRAGLLGALGHRHAVLGRELGGRVCYDPARPAATRGEITLPTASLVIDSAEGRRLADLGEGPGADDVEEIQATLLSGEYLAAAAHPTIGFALTSLRVGREGPMQLTGEFTLRGETRPVTLPATVQRGEGGALRVEGSFTVLHSDFGMEPASVAGVVRVADPVEVRVRLVLESTGEGCGDG